MCLKQGPIYGGEIQQLNEDYSCKSVKQISGVNECVNSCDEEEVNPKGVGRGRKSGWTHNFPLQRTAQGGSGAVKQQQYPIALEGRVGLKAVTQTVVKDVFWNLVCGLITPQSCRHGRQTARIGWCKM